MSWSRPAIPAAGDPAPFEGSAALAVYLTTPPLVMAMTSRARSSSSSVISPSASTSSRIDFPVFTDCLMISADFS